MKWCREVISHRVDFNASVNGGVELTYEDDGDLGSHCDGCVSGIERDLL